MIKTMTEEDVSRIADYHNIDVCYKNLDRVLRAKTVFKLGIRCPCCPDDKDRYCGSPKCIKEVYTTGFCHCQLFTKK